MGEGPAPLALGPSSQATFDHISRLVRKRDALNAAIADAMPALAGSLERECQELRPSQISAIYETIRAWKLPEFSVLIAGAFGTTPARMTGWRLHPPSEAHEGFEGTFPLMYQVTPRRGVPCTYVLLQGQRIMYVGKSIHVRARLKTHWEDREKRQRINRWQIHVCATERDALELEGTLIFQHQPPLNKADKQRRRAG